MNYVCAIPPGSSIWPCRSMMTSEAAEKQLTISAEWPMALILSSSTTKPPSRKTRHLESMVTIIALWNRVSELLEAPSMGGCWIGLRYCRGDLR